MVRERSSAIADNRVLKIIKLAHSITDGSQEETE